MIGDNPHADGQGARSVGIPVVLVRAGTGAPEVGAGGGAGRPEALSAPDALAALELVLGA